MDCGCWSLGDDRDAFLNIFKMELFINDLLTSSESELPKDFRMAHTSRKTRYPFFHPRCLSVETLTSHLFDDLSYACWRNCSGIPLEARQFFTSISRTRVFSRTSRASQASHSPSSRGSWSAAIYSDAVDDGPSRRLLRASRRNLSPLKVSFDMSNLHFGGSAVSLSPANSVGRELCAYLTGIHHEGDVKSVTITTSRLLPPLR